MSERKVYLLSPKELSPEAVAVAFAKTSRSSQSFHTIAAELTGEKSAQFHEKWVVGYGHASVAEHAVLHIAFENVSRLAIESIESNRLASYTEKSTRYQKWGLEDFYIPPELDVHPLCDDYVSTCRLLFRIYADSLDSVKKLVKEKDPPRPDESEEAWDKRIRSRYMDTCRFLLPAASLANLGMTANARSLEHAIRKMLSHPLVEVRQIGLEVKRVAQGEVPTLVKYVEPASYLVEVSRDFGDRGRGISSLHCDDWCVLVDYDRDGEAKVLAATLYRFGNMSYHQALQAVHSAPDPERAGLADALLGRLSSHDLPLREMEHSVYTFDIVMDQGAYAEFKRHRMMTQTPQALTARLGYALPRLIVEAGFESRYRQAMEAAAATYEKLAEFNPHVASYVVPNGFNRGVLYTMNLREAYHFCQLRAVTNAHYSIRRVALRVVEEICRVHPLLAKYINLPEKEAWENIEAQYFTAVA